MVLITVLLRKRLRRLLTRADQKAGAASWLRPHSTGMILAIRRSMTTAQDGVSELPEASSEVFSSGRRVVAPFRVEEFGCAFADLARSVAVVLGVAACCCDVVVADEAGDVFEVEGAGSEQVRHDRRVGAAWGFHRR